MTQAVGALAGHFILCGYGRVGSTVARELAHAGQRFVVVDINPASLAPAAPTATSWSTAMRPATRSCARPGSSGRAAWSRRSIRTPTTSTSRCRPAPLNPELFIVARANAGRLGGEARSGRRRPGRLAVHAGRSADRRARGPAAGRRLHRLRAVARRARVLDRGGRGRGRAARSTGEPSGRCGMRASSRWRSSAATATTSRTRPPTGSSRPARSSSCPVRPRSSATCASGPDRLRASRPSQPASVSRARSVRCRRPRDGGFGRDDRRADDPGVVAQHRGDDRRTDREPRDELVARSC